MPGRCLLRQRRLVDEHVEEKLHLGSADEPDGSFHRLIQGRITTKIFVIKPRVHDLVDLAAELAIIFSRRDFTADQLVIIAAELFDGFIVDEPVNADKAVVPEVLHVCGI